MPLARNLNKHSAKKFKLPKINKKLIWLIAFAATGLGVYGVINLTRIAPWESKKMEVKYETGDRPLPQKIKLWVMADGGLYMREKAEPKGKILILIPNNTALEADESQNGWYKVSFMNKTGWVKEGFVTTQAPAEDPTKNYQTLVAKESGFSLRYPKDWVVQNYGANPASSSVAYYAFGAQLPAALDPVSLPPIILRVSSQSKEETEKNFTAMGATAEAASVSNLPGTKFTYNSSAGTQMTAYVVGRGATAVVIEETGGYADELSLIIKTITFN